MDTWDVVDDSSLPTTFRGLLRLVREDHVINSEGLWTPGFYALAVHRLGAWLAVASIPERPRHILLRLHKVAFTVMRIAVGIELPRTARIGRRVRFAHQNGVVIHQFAVIGDDTLVRHGVTLGARSNNPETYYSEAPTIGRRVMLGVGCVVAGSIRVGDDARIGPNTVVLEDVPAGAAVLPSQITVRPRQQSSSRAKPAQQGN